MKTNATTPNQGMNGNHQHCQQLRPMTTAEAAQAMAKLAELATKGQPLALGLWNGTLTGTDSGNVYQGEHVSVFTDETLFALFGPQGDQAGEALLVLAARYAAGFAQALPENFKPGRVAGLCQPIIDGYAAEKSGLDDDMVSHLVALADEAASIQAMERELLRAHSALRAVLSVYDCNGNRDPERNPLESSALRAVYDALGMRWPVGA